MLFLRRILKHSPAVILGLLMIAWLHSLYGVFGLSLNHLRIGFRSGTVFVESGLDTRFQLLQVYGGLSGRRGMLLGELYINHWEYNGSWEIGCPILLLCTAVLPLGVGPFLSFRFRLWHYLAYTTLVAVELAYYLRWQQ